jgi:hypothetical protein
LNRHARIAELYRELAAHHARLALDEGTGIHRTQLFAKLHRATGGRVAADGWETLPAEEGAA